MGCPHSRGWVKICTTDAKISWPVQQVNEMSWIASTKDSSWRKKKRFLVKSAESSYLSPQLPHNKETSWPQSQPVDKYHRPSRSQCHQQFSWYEIDIIMYSVEYIYNITSVNRTCSLQRAAVIGWKCIAASARTTNSNTKTRIEYPPPFTSLFRLNQPVLSFPSTDSSRVSTSTHTKGK